MIRFEQVSKAYERGARALDEVSFHLERGEFACLSGPSGSGKSTLLRLIYRAERPTSGRVLVGGQDVGRLGPARVQALRRRMGIVFQDWRLIPDRDVFSNVTFVLRAVGLNPRDQKSRALEVLRWVGLSHRMRSRPEELSGGEQQRVAIARAVAVDPEILLADEPTGNLDHDLSLEILEIFRKIHARGTTILLATHDPLLLGALKRRVLRLEHGRLKVEAAA
jgi:cell division transport system ATP-binding protein